jgi:hypothetical protein
MMEILSADTVYNGRIYAKTLFIDSVGDNGELKTMLRKRILDQIKADQNLSGEPVFRVRYGKIKVVFETLECSQTEAPERVKEPLTAA